MFTGGILLIISYICSSIYARTDISDITLKNCSNCRYIYNKSGTKLFADFDMSEKADRFAVFYLGYGCNLQAVTQLQNFYLKQNTGVISIYANGYLKSCGKKKQSDAVLKDDLECWLSLISDMFGQKSKIILHGFSSTALSCFLCSKSNQVVIDALIIDTPYIFPVYLYKDIKNKFILRFFKKKSRVNIPETSISTLIISSKTQSKDSYKIYESCTKEKSLYIYDKLDLNEYTNKLETFLLRHSKLPEE